MDVNLVMNNYYIYIAEKRSYIPGLIIMISVVGVGVLYGIMNGALLLDNLSSSLPLLKSKDLSVSETDNVVVINETTIADVKTELAASESEIVREPQIAGEITKNVTIDSQQNTMTKLVVQLQKCDLRQTEYRVSTNSCYIYTTWSSRIISCSKSFSSSVSDCFIG